MGTTPYANGMFSLVFSIFKDGKEESAFVTLYLYPKENGSRDLLIEGF